MNVAINGFGRIGRTVFKAALERKVNIVAINAAHDIKDVAYLLRYDSTYGKYNKDVKIKKDSLIIGKKNIKILNQRDPKKLPWKRLKVDTVIESTGVFRDRKGLSKHLESGAKKVLISAPSKNPDITIVPGVNHKKLKKNHDIISVASCTTNCLAPVMKVLHDKFKIQRALVTTVHAYTNDQTLQDDFHQKLRRGRAAATNIIPTTTGAANAVVEVIPELKGRITGLAVRVPVVCGSLIDLVAELKQRFTVKSINAEFKRASKSYMKGIIGYSDEELVSSDVIGDPRSAVIDSLSTQQNGNLVKVLAWYDNEYAYSLRMIDVLNMLKK